MVKQVGPFELGKCVGKGATASVYLAHEPIRRKDVAIKQLKHSENSRRTIAHEVPKAAPASSAASPPPHNCPCLVGAEAASPSWCVQPVSLSPPARWARGSRIRRRAIACLNALLVSAHPCSRPLGPLLSVLPQVETMTKLAHENVAQIYTKLEEHGCTYLVMEIIGGGELFDTARLPALCPHA
jgi:serine/threonine protein kinase